MAVVLPEPGEPVIRMCSHSLLAGITLAPSLIPIGADGFLTKAITRLR
jgi:hypothetical protein